MKTICLIVVTFSLSFSFAQTAVEDVANVDKHLNELILKNNASKAAQFYTEDFLLVTSGGSRKLKKDIVAEIGSVDLKIIVNETQQVRIRVHENTAVLTGILHQKGSYKGKEFDVKLLVTDTWVKTDTGWKLLSGHASKAPESIP